MKTDMPNRKIHYGAIPLHADGREMMGTHGGVYRERDGLYVAAEVLAGDYVSVENFVRFTLNKYGVHEVKYAIYHGGFGSSGRLAATVECWNPSNDRKGR